jgi:hypothetical protein
LPFFLPETFVSSFLQLSVAPMPGRQLSQTDWQDSGYGFSIYLEFA